MRKTAKRKNEKGRNGSFLRKTLGNEVQNP
jgi:hypothetical protein